MMSFWRMRCGCPWSTVPAGRPREAPPPRCCRPVCPVLWVHLSSRRRTGSLPLRAAVLGHSPDRVRRAPRYRKVTWGGDKALVETAVCRAGRQPLRLCVCSVWSCISVGASPEAQNVSGTGDPVFHPGCPGFSGSGLLQTRNTRRSGRVSRRAQAPGGTGLAAPAQPPPPCPLPCRGSVPVPTGRDPARAR